ncbi:MAG: hypothetical protein ACE10D_06455, partial [Planctomycetota bacterium]
MMPPLRLGLVLLCLAVASTARGQSVDTADVALDFGKAFMAGDARQQRTLAARPGVEYAVVVHELLRSNEIGAAAALAALRAKEVDGPGLRRQVDLVRARVITTDAQRLAIDDAGKYFKKGNLAAARTVINGVVAPPEGSLERAQYMHLRAQATPAQQQREAWADAVEAAADAGWTQEELRSYAHLIAAAQRAGDAKGALQAADARLALAVRARDTRLQGQALVQRAALRRAAGEFVEERKDLEEAHKLALKLNAVQATLLYTKIAESWQVEGKPGRALMLYETAETEWREHASRDGKKTRTQLDKLLLNKAVALRDLARYGEALRTLDEAGRNEELAAYVARERAYVLMRAGMLCEARKAYEELISRAAEPELGALRTQLAQVLTLMADFRGAQRLFTQVLEEDDKVADAWAGLAAVHSVRSEEREALGAFKRAYELYKNSGRVAEAGRLLMRRAASEVRWGRPDSALRTLNRARELLLEVTDHGNLATLYLMRGEAYLLSGELDKAYKDIKDGAIYKRVL